MGRHVVAVVDPHHDFALTRRRWSHNRAMHRREAGEHGKRAPGHAARRYGIVVRHDNHVRAERDLRRQSRLGPRLVGHIHAPAQPVRIRPHRKGDGVGIEGGRPNHARTRGGHVHGHRGLALAQPLEAAAIGLLGEFQLIQRRVRVEGHRLPPQIAPELLQVLLERGHGRRRIAQVRHRRIPTPNPQIGAPAAQRLDRRDRRRRHRGMTGERIGHTGAQLQRRRRVRRQRQRDVAVGLQILRIPEPDPVPTHCLGALRVFSHVPPTDARPEFNTGHLRHLPSRSALPARESTVGAKPVAATCT